MLTTMDYKSVRIAGVKVMPEAEYRAAMADYLHALGEGRAAEAPSRLTPVFAPADTGDGDSPEAVTVGMTSAAGRRFDPGAPSRGGWVPMPKADPRAAGREESDADGEYPDSKPLSSKQSGFRAMIKDYVKEVPKQVLLNWTRNTLLRLGQGQFGLGDPLASLGGIGHPLLSVGVPVAAALFKGLGSVLRGGGLGDAFSVSPDALKGLGKGLLSLWEVDDDDSFGEHLAQFAAKKCTGLLVRPDKALSKIEEAYKKYFVGQTSSATQLVLRQCDPDLAGQKVVTAACTVYADGLPVARVEDVVEVGGQQVYKGAATVLCEGKMTGRQYESVSATAPLIPCATTVFIGGPGGGLGPNDPPMCKAPEGNATPAGPATQCDKPTTEEGWAQFQEKHGLTDEQIAELKTKPASYFTREWDPRKGWGSTPFEQEQLPGAPDWLRDLMRADSDGTTTLGFPMEQGNWYLFGGLLDLGSPELPGAGTGALWFVPDRIGPFSMADYFVRHDALFDPENQSLAERIGVEMDAFGTGVKPDLAQVILQIIYSSATTGASLSTPYGDDA